MTARNKVLEAARGWSVKAIDDTVYYKHLDSDTMLVVEYSPEGHYFGSDMYVGSDLLPGKMTIEQLIWKIGKINESNTKLH